MKSRNNTNKKTGRYDNTIITLAEANPQLDIVKLSVLFDNLGGRVGEAEPNLIRIMNIEYFRNLLHSNENEAVNMGITFSQLENFFQNSLENNIEVFEELMNIQATKSLFIDNQTNRPLINLGDLGGFFRNSLGGDIGLYRRVMTDDIMRFVINHEAPSSAISELGNFFQNSLERNIEIFEELIQNQVIQILLGFNVEMPSIDLNDLGEFFQESLGGNIEIFRRIMTNDIMRLLTDDLDNPIIALGDLGNFFRDSLSGSIEAFATVINTPRIIELLGINQDNVVQITITELGKYCQQALQDNSLVEAINNVQVAEDPVQHILGEIGVPIIHQEDDQLMGEDNVMLE